jgi:hypothetical protein
MLAASQKKVVNTFCGREHGPPWEFPGYATADRMTKGIIHPDFAEMDMWKKIQ